MLKIIRRILHKDYHTNSFSEKPCKMKKISNHVYKARFGEMDFIIKKKNLYNWKREVEILQRLSNCPSCMRLVKETDENVVLNYFDGGDLLNFYNGLGRCFSITESCKIAYDLSQTLIQMHDLGVHHLDLKLDNICFYKQDYTKVFLIDFENSEILDDVPLKTIVGSRTYISPDYIEICRDLAAKKKVSKTRFIYIDVWCLGVVLYTLLFGIYPFDDQNANLTVTISKVEALKYTIPKKQGEELPVELKKLIESIFVKCGEERPTLEEISLILELFIPQNAI